VLAGLGFSQQDMTRPVEEMSGGWAMRVALARLLLSEPDVLLLDEPTNHLDLDSLLWLEEYLRTIPSTLMVISHDRAFLDRISQRLLEVENGQVTSYPGNYQRYLEEKEKHLQAQWAAYRQQQEQIRQINRFIDRNRARKDRARQVQARLKTLDKMERIQPPSSPLEFSFRFPPPPRAPRVLLELRAICKSYGEVVVYRHLNVAVQRGDRFALIGPNGAGKTTLLRLMAGVLAPESGQVHLSRGVVIGYFAQQQLELLNPQHTVLESLSSVAGDMAHGQLRSLLGAFLFRGHDVEKRVAVLSGGERSRLLLCHLLAQQTNLLILDEPTNHLDINGRRVLEQALQGYSGSICFVSHDRRFINAVANKIMVVNHGRVETFPGNFDDYEEIWKKRLQPAQSAMESRPTRVQDASAQKKSKKRKQLEANWRNELYRLKAPLTQKLDDIEKQIDAAALRLEELSTLLAAPETYHNGGSVQELSREYQHLKGNLEKWNEQWEKTALELEALEEFFWEQKQRETAD